MRLPSNLPSARGDTIAINEAPAPGSGVGGHARAGVTPSVSQIQCTGRACRWRDELNELNERHVNG